MKINVKTSLHPDLWYILYLTSLVNVLTPQQEFQCGTFHFSTTDRAIVNTSATHDRKIQACKNSVTETV